MKRLSTASLMLSTLLVGCGPIDAEDEACEHFEDGPVSALTARNDWGGAGEWPTVSNDHKHYDITVPEGRYSYFGSVSFEVSEAANYAFFLSPEVSSSSLTISPPGGSYVALQEYAKSSEECSAIQSRYVASLQKGRHSIFFAWGPSRVSLVIEKLPQ